MMLNNAAAPQVHQLVPPQFTGSISHGQRQWMMMAMNPGFLQGYMMANMRYQT